ncbi:MAG TPA: hypothetical protein VEP73_07830 [Actinomycetota bacterium]|nr:hypothetical protein [Actinomycetota bacterium]
MPQAEDDHVGDHREDGDRADGQVQAALPRSPGGEGPPPGRRQHGRVERRSEAERGEVGEVPDGEAGHRDREDRQRRKGRAGPGARHPGAPAGIMVGGGRQDG